MKPRLDNDKLQCEHCKKHAELNKDLICSECNDNIRRCTCCGEKMDSGYIYEGDVYCSGECLPIALSQFKEEYTEDGDNCWTEWESIYED